MNLNTKTLLFSIYAVIVAGFCLTFVAGVFALTVEPDEVWNLMSTMKAFGLPMPHTSALDSPVTTTGGLHFVLHGLIALWRSGDIAIHRFASLAVTLILLGVVFGVVERHVKDRVLALAGTAVFAAAPGLLLQASLATSEIIATTTFLLATLFWVRYGSRSVAMALLGGVLFGLACATRMTCLSMLPALLVWSIFAHRGWAARLGYPLLAVGISVLVFVGMVAIYFAAFGDTPWSEFMVAAGSASGITRPSLGILMRLNHVVVGDGIIPVLAVLALMGWFFCRLESDGDDPEPLGLCGFLLLAGGMGWLAWLLKAPIPHIRYLWPAIPMVWLAAILLGLTALGRSKRPRSVSVTHGVLVVACAIQGLLNVRMLAVGDSLALVYEVARGVRLGTPRDFLAPRKNQQILAGKLATLPASTTVLAFTAEAAYPMTYLSGRTVKALLEPVNASVGDYLLVQPSDHLIWRPRWELLSWLQNNTTLVERQGDYSLYRVYGNIHADSK